MRVERAYYIMNTETKIFSLVFTEANTDRPIKSNRPDWKQLRIRLIFQRPAHLSVEQFMRSVFMATNFFS